MKFLFSHIPKCGGTTIRSLLRQAYGPDFHEPHLTVFGEQQRREHPDLSHVDEWTILTGHIGPEILPKVGLDIPVFTWIRDPLERRLSSVFHNARNHQKGSRPIASDFWWRKEELERIRHRFLSEKDFVYTDLWRGHENEAAFVGRVEHFAEDWQRCAEFFGFPGSVLADATSRQNANPEVDSSRYYELLDALGLTREKVCRAVPAFEEEFRVYDNLLAKTAHE